tara:strand:- start:220 stop:561 length:342 start_codon:yes stop_codon:yes gene_type:complete
MEIIQKPKVNGVTTESGTTITTNVPLGQRPQGDDEFDAALKKLENTFNVLVDRLNALEGSLKVLQETNKKLESTVALLDPFKNFREPLVLTEDMEVKEPSWKDLVKEENDGHK